MDPDYEDYRNVSADISKRPLNSNSVEEVEKKVAAVLDSQLSKEITGLESDIFEVDKRLNETKLLLDRLRAAILISYYDRAEGKTQGAQQGIHPAVQTEISKCGNSATGSTTIDKNEKSLLKPVGSVPKPIKRLPESISTAKNSGPSKTKHRIVVGNVSKYIPVDSRQKNDQSTHKWMVYVRGPREQPNIAPIVSKVWFFLHPTYKPNDLVEITTPPFHLTRRGWGEFPVRVKLHLKDCRGRMVDIIHMLKLDRTYTGEQSLGAETHVDVEVETSLPTSKPADVTKNEVPKPIELDAALTGHSAVDSTIRHPSPQKCQSAKLDEKPVEKVSEEKQTGCVLQKSDDSYSDVSDCPLPKKPRLSADNNSIENHSVKASNSTTLKSNTSNKMAVKLVKVLNHPPNTNGSISLLSKTKFTKSLLKPLQKLSSTSTTPSTAAAGHFSNSISNSTSNKQTLISLGGALPNPLVQNHNTNSIVQSAPVTSNCKPHDMTSIKSKSSLDLMACTSPDVFKCRLPDGRIMLVKKRKEPVSQPSSATKSAVGQNIGAKVQPTRIPASSYAVGKASAAVQGDTSLTYQLPDLSLIPDISSLVGHLAKLYPLIWESSSNDSPLQPTLQTYMSWPVGKRRALELHRANNIKSSLQKYITKSNTAFYGQKLWTTKQIMVWCRQNLYTPCTSPEDRLSCSPVNNSPTNELSLLARSILVQGVSPRDISMKEDSLEVDVISQTSDKKDPVLEKESVKNKETAVIIPPTKESRWIQQLTGQIGVNLNTVSSAASGVSNSITAHVMYKLYNIFMEDLIRKSFATKTGDDTVDLTVRDVLAAIKSSENFSFLNSTFFDEVSSQVTS